MPKIPTLVNYQKLGKESDFMLILFFKKNEYFKAEAIRLVNLRSTRELDKLVSRATKQESTLKPAPGK